MALAIGQIPPLFNCAKRFGKRLPKGLYVNVGAVCKNFHPQKNPNLTKPCGNSGRQRLYVNEHGPPGDFGGHYRLPPCRGFFVATCLPSTVSTTSSDSEAGIVDVVCIEVGETATGA
ncbi:MAG: hypothetical protein ABSD28_11310, partial [Tepidisphaeraceae bacterium]